MGATLVVQNQIIKGNCFEIIKNFPDGTFDAIITDPPYFNTNLKFDQVKFDWAVLWEELKRVVKPNGLILVFSQMKPSIEVITSNFKWFRYSIVWHKTMPVGFLDANRKPLKAHELILYFSKTTKNTPYNPQKTKGKKYKTKSNTANHYGSHKSVITDNKGERYPVDVITFNNNNFKSLHPTAKPVNLIKYLVKTYTNENGLILDPFAGSGTLAIACLETNRRYVCIEQDDEYFEVMERRIAQWHNDKLDSTGTHELPEDIERIKEDNSGQLSLF